MLTLGRLTNQVLGPGAGARDPAANETRRALVEAERGEEPCPLAAGIQRQRAMLNPGANGSNTSAYGMTGGTAPNQRPRERDPGTHSPLTHGE